MTFTAIKHISYSVAGGFAGGTLAALAITSTVPVRTAGAAYPYFRYIGIAVGVTAAVGRAVDEIFKAAGWTKDVGMRLLAAHIVTGLIMIKPMLILINDPTPAGKLVTLALSVYSLVINVIVK